MTIRELTSLTGSLVSTFPGVEFGPSHYRTLEHDKNFALKRSPGNFDAPATLSFDSINDLDWWIKSLPTAFKTIDHKAPELILNTGASQIGWEASFLRAKTQGIWTYDKRTGPHKQIRATCYKIWSTISSSQCS